MENIQRNYCVTENGSIYADFLTEAIAYELAEFKHEECKFENDNEYISREMTIEELNIL